MEKQKTNISTYIIVLCFAVIFGTIIVSHSRDDCSPRLLEPENLIINFTEREENRPSSMIIETPAVIIYNRVGKSGSRTVLSVIKSSFRSRDADIRYISDTKKDDSLAFTSSQQAEVILKTNNGSFPVLYARHMNFINYESLNATVIPAYINLVRHPVDRFVSHFYFRRNGDNRLLGRRVISESKNLNYVSIVNFVGPSGLPVGSLPNICFVMTLFNQ